MLFSVASWRCRDLLLCLLYLLFFFFEKNISCFTETASAQTAERFSLQRVLAPCRMRLSLSCPSVKASTNKTSSITAVLFVHISFVVLIGGLPLFRASKRARGVGARRDNYVERRVYRRVEMQCSLFWNGMFRDTSQLGAKAKKRPKKIV